MTNALLASYNVSMWSVTRTNRKITNDVNTSLSESMKQHKVGRYMRNLIDTSAPEYRAVCRARDLGRKLHYAYTLPWQEGLRLLNPLAVDDYREQMQLAKDLFDAAVTDFIAVFDDLMADAHDALKAEAQDKYWRSSDYPDEDDLADLFCMTTVLSPIPHNDEFAQVSNIIGAELASELSAELQSQQTEQWATATKSVWQRLEKALRHASDMLSNGQRIHASVMDNLQELTDLLPVLNITNDAALETSRKELQSLFRTYSQEALKNKNDYGEFPARANCAAEVDAILAKLP